VLAVLVDASVDRTDRIWGTDVGIPVSGDSGARLVMVMMVALGGTAAGAYAASSPGAMPCSRKMARSLSSSAFTRQDDRDRANIERDREVSARTRGHPRVDPEARQASR
jgi:hypothetical protein